MSGAGWGEPFPYVELMWRSVFCICPAGFGQWSRRLTDSILVGCIPVIVADFYALPFAEFMRWDAFTLRIHSSSVRSLPDILRSISSERVRELQMGLEEVRPYFDACAPMESSALARMIVRSVASVMTQESRPIHSFK